MKKRYLTIGMLLLFVLVHMFSAENIKATAEILADSDEESPNVILILSDDQGWGDLSQHGNRNLSTPSIDRLAKEGASFSNFYVSPVCSPTRAEILAGRYHPRGGVYSTSAGGERLDLDEQTIAEVFKEAGYRTALFGKWHSGMQYPYHPNGRGFDEFYGFASGHWGDYFSPNLLEYNGQLVGGDGYIPNDLTDKALSFIKKNREQPFFVHLSYNTPHSPMQVPDRWWQKFEDSSLPMRHHDPQKEELRFTRAALAMCENIDWNVGRLLDYLEKSGLDENTIMIYASDNGPNSWRWNGGMRGRKGSTDEEGVRSPLLIRWPGMIEADTSISEISGAIDLLPTLADLANIKLNPPKPLDGRSLEPLILGDVPSSWEDRLLFSHWNGNTSVRSQNYRLDHEGQLYDITKDRGQKHDISDRFPQITQRLSDTLAAWEQQVIPKDIGRDRPFPLGHAAFKYTQLPARDAITHGSIKRSNRYPNSSFFTNWKNSQDSLTWDVEVLESGLYQVELYYSCPPEDVGSTIILDFGGNSLKEQITAGHDPPLEGMKQDRVKRIESYVKDFRPLDMGTIQLNVGRGTLSLKATDIPGEQVMDFRLLMFTRIEK